MKQVFLITVSVVVMVVSSQGQQCAGRGNTRNGDGCCTTADCQSGSYCADAAFFGAAMTCQKLTTQNDDNNCGIAGHVCPIGEYCSSGVCIFTDGTFGPTPEEPPANAQRQPVPPRLIKNIQPSFRRRLTARELGIA